MTSKVYIKIIEVSQLTETVVQLLDISYEITNRNKNMKYLLHHLDG